MLIQRFSVLSVPDGSVYLLCFLLDLYCTLEVDSYGYFVSKAKTRVFRDTMEPHWNEEFEIELEGSQFLRILCYENCYDKSLLNKDDNEIVDKIMGKGQVQLPVRETNAAAAAGNIHFEPTTAKKTNKHTTCSLARCERGEIEKSNRNRERKTERGNGIAHVDPPSSKQFCWAPISSNLIHTWRAWLARPRRDRDGGGEWEQEPQMVANYAMLRLISCLSLPASAERLISRIVWGLSIPVWSVADSPVDCNTVVTPDRSVMIFSFMYRIYAQHPSPPNHIIISSSLLVLPAHVILGDCVQSAVAPVNAAREIKEVEWVMQGRAEHADPSWDLDLSPDPARCEESPCTASYWKICNRLQSQDLPVYISQAWTQSCSIFMSGSSRFSVIGRVALKHAGGGQRIAESTESRCLSGPQSQVEFGVEIRT
ncbi:hypothetical protein NQZ68_036533 [Dissostichus eleginoides]|nr:hypothetical protein NQZ68_036533 [Dissostichus eleginoides]